MAAHLWFISRTVDVLHMALTNTNTNTNNTTDLSDYTTETLDIEMPRLLSDNPVESIHSDMSRLDGCLQSDNVNSVNSSLRISNGFRGIRPLDGGLFSSSSSESCEQFEDEDDDDVVEFVDSDDDRIGPVYMARFDHVPWGVQRQEVIAGIRQPHFPRAWYDSEQPPTYQQIVQWHQEIVLDQLGDSSSNEDEASIEDDYEGWDGAINQGLHEILNTQQQQQQLEETVTYSYNFNDAPECICWGEVQDSLIVHFSCGHNMHNDCFKNHVIAQNDLTEDGRPRCPSCRRIIEFAAAEGSFHTIVCEYATTEQESLDLEYDDPLPFDQVKSRPGGMQCFVFTGSAKAGEFVVQGNILQVKNLQTNTYITYNCKEFEVKGDNIEIQIISTDFLKEKVVERCSFVLKKKEPIVTYNSAKQETKVEMPVVVSKGEKCNIIILGMGTYGDLKPLESLSIILRQMGHSVDTSFPDTMHSTIPLHWEPLLRSFRKSSTVIPSFDTLLNTDYVTSCALALKRIFDAKHYDHIIASVCYPGIKLLSRLYQVPYTLLSSIPLGRGANAYLHFDTQFAMVSAKWIEYLQFALPVLMFDRVFPGQLITDDFKFTECENVIYSVAPEIMLNGMGNFVLQEPGLEKYDYDVFYCLGSLASKEYDEKMIQILLKSKLRVLFQTKFRKGSLRNITFIGESNHETIMAQVPIVICHGGSGTLQTALRHGCMVLVKPFWVDQRYWPLVYTSKGYPVIEIKDDEAGVLEQLAAYAKTPFHKMKRLSGHSPEYFARVINSRITVQPDIENGVYVYARPTDDGFTRVLGQIERTIFRHGRLLHVGIIIVKDGVSIYYDYAPHPSRIICSNGVGIHPETIYLKKVADDFDLGEFIRSVDTSYSIFNNCRTYMNRYLKNKGCSLSDIDKEFSRKYWGTVPVQTSYLNLELVPKFVGEEVRISDMIGNWRPIVDEARRGMMVKQGNATNNGQCDVTGKRVVDMERFNDADFSTIVSDKRIEEWQSTNTVYDVTSSPALIVGNGPVVYISQKQGQIIQYVPREYAFDINLYEKADIPWDGDLIKPVGAPLAKELKLNIYQKRALLDMIRKYDVYEARFMYGAESTALIGRKYVIKVSLARCQDYIEEVCIDGVYIIVMHYLPDDGLTVHSSIVYKRKGTTVTDVHRNNVRSMNGYAILIDQSINKVDTKIHLTIKDLRDALGVQEAGGSGLCFFYSIAYGTQKTALELKEEMRPAFDEIVKVMDKKPDYDDWDDSSDFYAAAYAITYRRSVIVFDQEYNVIVKVGDGPSTMVYRLPGHYQAVTHS